MHTNPLNNMADDNNGQEVALSQDGLEAETKAEEKTLDPNTHNFALTPDSASDTSPKKKVIDIDRVEADVENALKTYNTSAIRLRTLMIILGILAVGLSLFVSTFIGTINEVATKIVSYIGSFSLALLSYFSIVNKGNNFRNAWRHLQNANERYFAGIITIGELIKAYGEAEAILGDTNFTYQIPEKK